MHNTFTAEQLKNPNGRSNEIFACLVSICLAFAHRHMPDLSDFGREVGTSPRGAIYLIKDMLENDRRSG